jgi:hypothetical protein
VKSVVGVLVLLGFAALGFALASDFCGFARRHAERSLARVRPISDLLRRNGTPEAAQRRLARANLSHRSVGLMFLLGSLAALVAVFHALPFLIFALVGLAFALDFRGLSSDTVRRSVWNRRQARGRSRIARRGRRCGGVELVFHGVAEFAQKAFELLEQVGWVLGHHAAHAGAERAEEFVG